MSTLELELDGVQVLKMEVPKKAARPLLAYLRRHERLIPYDISAAVFMRHWNMGVNLSKTQNATNA